MSEVKNNPDGSVIFQCGPGNDKCKCECPDGPCTHKWDGEGISGEYGGREESVTCSKCGMSAMSHSMWVGP